MCICSCSSYVILFVCRFAALILCTTIVHFEASGCSYTHPIFYECFFVDILKLFGSSLTLSCSFLLRQSRKRGPPQWQVWRNASRPSWQVSSSANVAADLHGRSRRKWLAFATAGGQNLWYQRCTSQRRLFYSYLFISIHSCDVHVHLAPASWL